MYQPRGGARHNTSGGPRGRGGRASTSVRGGHGGPPFARGGAPPSAPLIYKGDHPVKIDARIDAADALITNLRVLKHGPEHPVRPGYGTLGRAVVVRANFFPVNLERDTYYEYIVEISPEPKSQKSRIKRRVLTLFELSAVARPYVDKVAHDGAQRLIAAERLPQPLRGNVEYYEDGDKGPSQNADRYSVEVKFSKELHTAPLKRFQEGDVADIDKAKKEIDPLISALNLIMQRQAAQFGFRFGKNRYFFDEDRKELGPRLLALMGFYSSVRPVHKQLMVNVNVCMAAFHQPGKLSDALHAFGERSHGSLPQAFMTKVKVSTRYRGYKCIKTISRVLSASANKQTFHCKEYGGQITVEQFFHKKYGIQVQEADTLPVIDIGNKDNSVYVPAELCEIEPGEPHLGRLGPKEMAAMLRHATWVVTLGLYSPTPVLDAFGVRMSGEMSIIPARELPAPKVTYAKGSPQVQNGSWNLRDVKFHRGAKALNWKVLVVCNSKGGPTFKGTTDPGLESFIKTFADKCRGSGIDLASRPSLILETGKLTRDDKDKRRTNATAQISRTIERFGNTKNIDFILCLLLEKALNNKGQEQYLANVALKLNTKLGGINHRLGREAMGWLMEKPTILVGIDVTHPSPKSAAGTPSIVGVVASIDHDFVQFPASLRLQKSKREVIKGTILRDMIVERLEAYRRHSKVLPERMIVFRDGVSEGQYDEVLKEELPQFFAAFQTVDAKNSKYHPTLSIIICGKRHHARFFATDSKHADKNGNTLAGTVVDKGVTSVLDFDFYLQAHAGLQGSVKSTHYVMLYDESALGPDDVQQGVHTASYLYARATKAVSLIPPAYYADILCERARYWIHEFLLAEPDDDWASIASTSPSPSPSTITSADKSPGGETKKKSAREAAEERVYKAAERAWGGGLHVNLRDSMFYL
ncbi:Piwi domain-containing protein [Multifurca ochricompacta]|uniref:Piwi domain-containing protein n=1 Tax=Multifurca ochricompacta TaxID=376703 RepID=A0AAD4QJI7_9AGAM|nr:Piwi domain-containing protein [Multifurca ochricompacta]